MDFKEKLSSIISNVEGAIACSLCGMDGVGIAAVSIDPNYESTSADVEFATMMRAASKAAENLKVGAVDELLVVTNKIIILVRMVGKDYYLSLALTPDGIIGRARLEMRKAIPELAKEF